MLFIPYVYGASRRLQNPPNPRKARPQPRNGPRRLRARAQPGFPRSATSAISRESASPAPLLSAAPFSSASDSPAPPGYLIGPRPLRTSFNRATRKPWFLATFLTAGGSKVRAALGYPWVAGPRVGRGRRRTPPHTHTSVSRMCPLPTWRGGGCTVSADPLSVQRGLPPPCSSGAHHGDAP